MVEKKETKRGVKVRTFTADVRIFQTMKELEVLDEQVNRFMIEKKVRRLISVSDTATTDNSGATIGLIRVLAYET
jgi:hypothetical protein